jgi:hypothetical protein
MEMIVNIDATWRKLPNWYLDDKDVVWNCFYTRVYGTDYLQLQVIVDHPAGFECSYRMNYDGGTFTREGRLVFTRLPKVTEWLRDNLPDPLEVEPIAGGLIYYRAVVRADRWGEGEELGEFDGATWLLAASLKTRGRFLLYAQDQALRRAAYYLQWNGDTLSDTPYRDELEKYRPDLYDTVIEALEEIAPLQTDETITKRIAI